MTNKRALDIIDVFIALSPEKREKVWKLVVIGYGTSDAEELLACMLKAGVPIPDHLKTGQPTR